MSKVSEEIDLTLLAGRVRLLGDGWYQGESPLFPAPTARAREHVEARRWITARVQSCLAENGYVPSGQTREEDDRRCSGDGPGCTGQRDWYHSPHRWYCTPCAMRYGYVGLSQVQGSWE